MANQNLTDITVILDRSGSMESIQGATVEGYNGFISDQKKQDGKATFTLVQFDDKYEVPVDCVDIQEVQPLNIFTFVPRGMTALLDAIGKTINSTGKRLADMNEDDKPSKVIMVIITDGDENRSYQFSREQINNMITHQTDVYSWEFIFLAANQDAIQAGASIGIKGASSMNFMATDDGLSRGFSAMSMSMNSYRSTGDYGTILQDADQGVVTTK